jgi:HEPN domain-containing protein
MVVRKNDSTQEDLDDEAERSRPVAYFNFADTYWTAAKALRRSKAKASHKDSPVRFLYYHAIELYLKAHLRAHKIHPYDMRNKFGHDAGKLSAKSAELGLDFDDEDLEIFDLMSKTDAVIRSRYILTGSYRLPDIDALNRTCKSLRLSVGKVLIAKKEPIRLGLRRKKARLQPGALSGLLNKA